jgi:hypothetical protein
MSEAKQSGRRIVRFARGQLKLKPTKIHRSKKAYNRRKEKTELRAQTAKIKTLCRA